MVEYIIGSKFLASLVSKNTLSLFDFIEGGQFYLDNKYKSNKVPEFYERNDIFKAAEKHIEALEEIVKEKENLLATMKDDSVAIIDLIKLK